VRLNYPTNDETKASETQRDEMYNNKVAMAGTTTTELDPDVKEAISRYFDGAMRLDKQKDVRVSFFLPRETFICTTKWFTTHKNKNE